MRKNCSQVILENFFEAGILYLLLQKPSYGYEIKKALRENCICEVNAGNLYRCLAYLEKQQYIRRKASKSSIGPQRYNYTITSQGKKYLAAWIKALKKQQQIISSLIINYQKLI